MDTSLPPVFVCVLAYIKNSLPYVVSVEFDNNAINGNLPSEIGALSLLGKSLAAFECLPLRHLFNRIRSFRILIENLSLQNLRLNKTIPTELGNLVNAGTFHSHREQCDVALRTIRCSRESFRCNFLFAEYIYLQNNTLTGTIPSELGRLAKLCKCLDMFSTNTLSCVRLVLTP